MSRYFFSKLVALLTGIILLVVAYIHNTNSLYYLSGDAYGTSWSISSSEYIADNHKDEIRNMKPGYTQISYETSDKSTPL